MSLLRKLRELPELTVGSNDTMIYAVDNGEDYQIKKEGLKSLLGLPKGPRIVLIGDSIVSTIFGSESLPYQIEKCFPGQSPDIISLGISGQTSTQILARAAADLAPYAPNTTGIPATIFENSGINDVTTTSLTAAQIYANKKAIWDIAKSLGYTVGTSTYFGFPFEVGQESVRLGIQDLLLANPNDYDWIARWDLINGKYRADMFRDSVHPNLALFKKIAASTIAGMQGRYPILLESFWGRINSSPVTTISGYTIIPFLAQSDAGSRWSGTQFATPSKSLYQVSGRIAWDGTVVAADQVFVALFINNVLTKFSSALVGVAYTAGSLGMDFNWVLKVEGWRTIDVRLYSTKILTVRNSPIETFLSIQQLPPIDTVL